MSMRKDNADPAPQPRNAAKPAMPATDRPLQPAGETVVNIDTTAAQPSPGKHIHRRRPLPPVPEAEPETNSTSERTKGDEADP